MKRLFVMLLLAVLLLNTAAAESLRVNAYTDVPTAMTQDSVAEVLVDQEAYLMEVLQPDEASVALLNDIYRFVREEDKRPAYYYDEETQQEIARLAGCKIDLLHMTEAMRLQLTGAPLEGETAPEAILATMRLNVEYRVGQLVIAVLGVAQEAEEGVTYTWYPYRGRVDALGEIKWDIPMEDWLALNQQPVSFHVLTDRIGPRGSHLWGVATPPASKTAGDVIGMRYWYTDGGEYIQDAFRVWLTDLTEPMQTEVQRMGEHVAAGAPLLDYFPQERKDEAAHMLPEGVDAAALVAYDVIALMDEEYKDTYGDVNAELFFGTAYEHDKAMVVLAGFPVADAQEAPFMDWYVLRAQALETTDGVEIGLKQLVLPRMEEEPLMLVVISEALEIQE